MSGDDRSDASDADSARAVQESACPVEGRLFRDSLWNAQQMLKRRQECISFHQGDLPDSSIYLGCTMHVEHLPRMSDWGAEVADRLSRRSTTISQDKKLLSAFKNRPIPDCLTQWFKEPEVDWSLPLRLLDSVKKLV